MNVLKFIGGYVTVCAVVGLIVVPMGTSKGYAKAEADFNSSKKGEK